MDPPRPSQFPLSQYLAPAQVQSELEMGPLGPRPQRRAVEARRPVESRREPAVAGHLRYHWAQQPGRTRRLSSQAPEARDAGRGGKPVTVQGGTRPTRPGG